MGSYHVQQSITRAGDVFRGCASRHLPAGDDVAAAGRDDSLQCDVQRADARGGGHDRRRLRSDLAGRSAHRVLHSRPRRLDSKSCGTKRNFTLLCRITMTL